LQFAFDSHFAYRSNSSQKNHVSSFCHRQRYMILLSSLNLYLALSAAGSARFRFAEDQAEN
jgi:hypothetical protein